MELSTQELRELAARAATITERRGPDIVPDPTPAGEQLAAARLEKWQQVVAPGHPAKFAQRLAWDDLDEASVRPLLGEVRLTAAASLPGWIDTLQAGFRVAAQAGVEVQPFKADPPPFIDLAVPYPFEELLTPFVLAARQKVIMQAGEEWNLLAEAVQAALERSLLKKLAMICLKTLSLEFSIFRLACRPGQGGWPALSNGEPSRELYERFIHKMLAGGLKSIFLNYSMLARLAATVVDFWVETQVEFLRRLAADQPQLQAAFQPQAVLGPVTAIESGLSDPHHGGRVALALTFASGLKLVYKPRNLGLEESYFYLLTWLNERGLPLPFKILKVLNRETYGWVEYVTPTPCQNKAEAARYYRRSGMLLALLYGLEATDCHLDNLIAAGDQPVLVDAETLMHPRPRQEEGKTTAFALAFQQILNSVLRTALLPSWRVEPQGQAAYDSSGLGAAGEQEMRHQIAWRNFNTDNMAVGYETDKVRSFTNAPFQEGADWSPANYVEEVVAGFEQMYRFLMQHRPALLAADSPLAVLARQPSRCLLRDTGGYYAVVEKSLNPKFLRSGVEWSIQLDILSRGVLAMDDEQVVYRSLLLVEYQALTQLDIPYFATRPDSDALFLSPDRAIPHFFSRPSYENTVALLQKLNYNDLVKQLEFIRAAYCARYINNSHLALTLPQETAVEGIKLTAEIPTTISLISTNLVQPALEIATGLQQRAIFSADGGEAAWLGLNYLAQVDRFQLQPLPSDLYNGNGGIAMFLAALEKVTGGAGYRALALAAARPIRLAVSGLLSQSAKPINLGGGQELGALIYVLTRVGQWLNEADLLAEARQTATLVTAEVVAADDKLDVLSGAAGIILSLLTLYRATGDPAILDRAAACGQHLLNKRVTAETGQQTWPNRPSTGFAHGPDGMTYALLQLYQIMQKTEKAGNSNHPSSFILHPSSLIPPPSLGWCRGAVGLGLARLGGLAVLDTPDIRQEIDLALQMALQAGWNGEDHLCCGNFGRLELLVVAAQRLSRPELLETARQQAAWLVNRAGENGGFHLFSGPGGNVYHPGFFRGAAGIGYQLLRLANPDALPSVLLWE